MRNEKYFLVIVFITFLFSSCESKNSNVKDNYNDKYLTTYAGGYTIEVVGYQSDNDAEVYVLHQNGNAKWMYIVNDGYGDAKIMSEKSGVWSADEGKIKVTIQGNTGPIVEEYVLRNGRFINTLSKDRYLKRSK